MLVHRNRRGLSSELDGRQGLAEWVFDMRALDLAQRIFDPADYVWLHDELCFPEAARVLAKHRQKLAVKWLKGLRNSIKELSHLAEPAAAESHKVPSWQLPWLTLRLHFLVSYALFVVRLSALTTSLFLILDGFNPSGVLDFQEFDWARWVRGECLR